MTVDELDNVLDVLGTELRREVIRLLQDDEKKSDLRLAEDVASAIGQDPDEVLSVLIHAHLPMLDAWDVIDVTDGWIEQDDRFEVVAEYLEVIEEVTV